MRALVTAGLWPTGNSEMRKDCLNNPCAGVQSGSDRLRRLLQLDTGTVTPDAIRGRYDEFDARLLLRNLSSVRIFGAAI